MSKRMLKIAAAVALLLTGLFTLAGAEPVRAALAALLFAAGAVAVAVFFAEKKAWLAAAGAYCLFAGALYLMSPVTGGFFTAGTMAAMCLLTPSGTALLLYICKRAAQGTAMAACAGLWTGVAVALSQARFASRNAPMIFLLCAAAAFLSMFAVSRRAGAWRLLAAGAFAVAGLLLYDGFGLLFFLSENARGILAAMMILTAAAVISRVIRE